MAGGRRNPDPSRGGGRGRRAGGRGGRGDLPGSADAEPGRPAPSGAGRAPGTAACSKHGRDHTPRRWQTGDCNVGQVFWRSGTSTASERAGRSPTGQRVRTVAQQHRPARSVGARGGHEGPVAIPGPHPTFQPAAYATRTSRCPPAPEAVDAATPVDANNRAHRSLQNRADAVSHSDHSHHLLLHQDVDEPGNRPGAPTRVQN